MSLKPFMDFAITNAERLDAMNEGKTPASSAPGTKEIGRASCRERV